MLSLKKIGWLLLFALPISANSATPRSQAVKAEFQRSHPCPANGQRRGACSGYVKDHIIALACGGLDSPNNLQWQTLEESKAKDKWERIDCKK